MLTNQLRGPRISGSDPALWLPPLAPPLPPSIASSNSSSIPPHIRPLAPELRRHDETIVRSSGPPRTGAARRRLLVAHRDPFGLLRNAVARRAARRDRDRSVRQPHHRGAHCRPGDSCLCVRSRDVGPGPQWDWRFEADLVTLIRFLPPVRRPPVPVGALAGRGGRSRSGTGPTAGSHSESFRRRDARQLRVASAATAAGSTGHSRRAESLARRARRRSMGRANVCGLSKNGRCLTSAFGARAGWPRGPRRCLHGSHEPWRTTASG
jgi:hypothetical protein